MCNFKQSIGHTLLLFGFLLIRCNRWPFCLWGHNPAFWRRPGPGLEHSWPLVMGCSLSHRMDKLVLLCPGQCPALPELKQVARSCTVVHFKKKKSRSLLSENRNCDKFSPCFAPSLHVDMYVYIKLNISFFLRLFLVKKWLCFLNWNFLHILKVSKHWAVQSLSYLV